MDGREWRYPMMRLTRILLLALVAIVLIAPASALSSGASAAVPPSRPLAAPLDHPSAGPTLRDAGSSARTTAVPSPPSARGVFFSSSVIPPSSNLTCGFVYGACVNDSYDSAINYSANAIAPGSLAPGVLGVAYTQITANSPCANATTYAQTEVGFSYSTNLGANWSTAQYLGIENCTLASLFPSAYQPSLTSLANGTFVLAYVAYNQTPNNPWFNQGLGGTGGYYTITGAALVLQMSYDGGATWAAPDVLNESLNPSVLVNCCDQNDTHAFTPQRPWVTAYGNTIYLAWTNDTYSAGFDFYCEVEINGYAPCYGEASSQVHLLVSKDGGASWAVSDLLTVRPPLNDTISAGEDPYVLVSPNGTVYVAYVTDFYLAPWSIRASTGDYLPTGSIEIATSWNNGSTFRYSTAASDLMLDVGPYAPPYQGNLWGEVIAPQLAWSQADSQLYVTWTMLDWGVDLYCPLTCPEDNLFENVYLTNSSDGGANWEPYHLVSPLLNNSLGAAAYNPAIAVLPSGQVDIAVSFVNFNASVNYCEYGPDDGYCPLQEVFVASTDDGQNFSTPILIDANISGNSEEDPSGWYDTATVVHGDAYFAWAHKISNNPPGIVSFWPTTCCGYGLSHSEIEVSTPYDGVGINLTFADAGLPAGFTWGVNVMGNLYNATAPTNIVVQGVPVGENLSWNVSIVLGSHYGFRYVSNQSPLSPTTFVRSSTIFENYSEQVLVQISTSPYGSECPSGYYGGLFCWNPGYSYYTSFDYNVYPFVGPRWLPDGVATALNVTLANLCFSSPSCYIDQPWLDLSFESWTGTGPGSVNVTQANTSITPTGPVNETASFAIIGLCTNANTGNFSPSCSFNESLEFHETGLPQGTLWNVTIQNNAGLTGTESSTTDALTFDSEATSGVVSYTIWTIPSATLGQVWIGSADPQSPVELPIDRIVNVTFQLQSASTGSFPVLLNETGLPNPSTSGWGVTLGNTTLALRSAQTTLDVGGGTYALTVPAVYFTNGTGYYATQVSVERLLVNESAPRNSTSFPTSIALDGPSIVRVVFSVEYRLTVGATIGGNATPDSEWVPAGQLTLLTATTDPGHTFLGWSGTGSGSLNASSAIVSVRPAGPLSETASFETNGPTLWTVVIGATGLPTGTEFSVTLGNSTYSGVGAFNITGLSSGVYALGIPIAYSNESAGARYLGSLTSTTFSRTGDVLTVGSDGSVSVAFSTQFTVSVAASPGGSTDPTPGIYWAAAGSPYSLRATSAPGYLFVGWSGAGSGSVSGTSLSIAPGIQGPITESAEFALLPVPANATYSLTVVASGLPTAATWSFQVGTESGTGTSATLAVSGLNGTYPVVIPPVSAGYGARYVPTDAPTSGVPVQSNQTITVQFQEQFWVAISSSTGGSVNVASLWVVAGASLALAASPTSGWKFLAWTGVGSGSYSGAAPSTSVTPTGPVNESASFNQNTIVRAANTTGTPWLGVGLAVLLAVLVAVIAAWMLSRRGRRIDPELPVNDGALAPIGEETVGEPAVEPEPTDPPSA
jgi:Divergent InlB B-repeat domain